MNIVKFPRNYSVYVALAVAAIVLTLFLPRAGKFNYDYRKGSPWMYDNLVAQFDFPILRTEAQILEQMQERSARNIPYYRKSADVPRSAAEALAAADFGKFSSLRQSLSSRLASIYSKGVVATNDAHLGDGFIYVQAGKKMVRYPVSEIYTVDGARAEIIALLSESLSPDSADSLCLAAGIYNILIPDLSYDRRTTEQINYQARADISLTDGVEHAGTVIVKEGEIVTEKVEQLLDSYKAEYDRTLSYKGPSFFHLLGEFLVSVLLVLLLFFVILYTNADIFGELNRFLFILLMFLMASIAALAVDRYAPSAIYMVPFSLIAMYLLAFFKKRVVLPVYVIALLPLMIFAHDGKMLYVMYLAAGILSIYTFSFFSHGWKQFVNAFFSFLALIAVWTVFQLVNGVGGLADYRVVIKLFGGSLLCVAGYPLIYLFEKVFGLVSKSRLQELCDTNANVLLRDLATKAPGTFQHSVQVMHMCEAAAQAIDANVELMRAGAMYHDIGKMLNPGCFIENTDGRNEYHEGLDCFESAHSIIRHTTDGLELARRHRLPSIVTEYIATHHGTTKTGFFYGRYLAGGGSPDSPEAARFQYPGPKPRKKGQVILMLCDSIEAASRSMKTERTSEALNSLVDKIIDGKIADGQLKDSEITMADLEIVRGVIKEHLRQIYHPRVAYPEASGDDGQKKPRK